MNNTLIIIFIVMFIITFIKIIRVDLFFGSSYLFLFIYTVFTQIGYVNFPILSELIKAYFGDDIFLSYWLFVFSSFILFYILFAIFNKKLIACNMYTVVKIKSKELVYIYYFIVVAKLMYLTIYFYKYSNVINYTNASDETFLASQGMFYFLFMFLFKMSVMFIIVTYCLYRLKSLEIFLFRRSQIKVILILELVLFLLISVKIGSRTDPLALAIGIATLEILIGKLNFRKFAKLILAALIILSLLIVVEYTRNDYKPTKEFGIIENIIFKDYFAPSHMLLAAINFNYIDPFVVIKSNIGNALIKLNYPFLQMIIADLFNPGSTRSASYAFYIFSEGFIALGWLGIVYNAFVVLLGLSFWRNLASSNSKIYNVFVYAMISTQLANIARSQSAYFIKTFYMFFLPGMLLFYLATGYRPSIKIKNG